MSNKLAKINKGWHKSSSKKLAKVAKKAGAKEAGLGKTGHKIIQTIGGIATGLLTKNVGPVKVPFTDFKVAPDAALTFGAGALFVFGKSLLGGKAKWAEDAMWAGINSIAGRWTWTGQLIVMPDGKTVRVDTREQAETKTEASPPRDVAGRVTVDDNGKPVIEVQTRAA